MIVIIIQNKSIEPNIYRKIKSKNHHVEIQRAF